MQLLKISSYTATVVALSLQFAEYAIHRDLKSLDLPSPNDTFYCPNRFE